MVHGRLNMAGWIAAALNFAWRAGKKLAFPFVAVPMGILSLSITICCCWFLVSYVVCCVSWWSLLGCSGYAWRIVTRTPHPREAKRKQSAMPDSLRKMSGSFQQRRSGLSNHRASMSTPGSASRECLVGDGTDRDFEGMGGWALSTDDDEALYMAKSFGQEPCFDDVTLSAPRFRRSASQSSGFVPSVPPSPGYTRTPNGYGPTKDDDRNYQGYPHQSRSSSPGAYFSLPQSRSTASLQRLRMSSSSIPEHRRKNSSVLSLSNIVTELQDSPVAMYES